MLIASYALEELGVADPHNAYVLLAAFVLCWPIVLPLALLAIFVVDDE